MPRKSVPPRQAPALPLQASPQARGERLRWLLDHVGWKQKDLAAKIGVSEPRLSKMLCGYPPIETDTALRISFVLGVPPDFILWGERARVDDELKRLLPPNL